MTTPFLEYELLSPETADPVIIRITGQRERGFKDFTASNGVEIWSLHHPQYVNFMRRLFVGGKTPQDDWEIRVPLADWPAVKRAIRELNEYYKETDMKEDRYEFPLDEWDAVGGGNALILTRKKPKVKVEYSKCSRFGDGLGEDGINFERHGYGMYYIVQFRVTGWDGEYVSLKKVVDELYCALVNYKHTLFHQHQGTKPDISIGLDARDKWSAPVLLPESIYSRLDEICRALEDKANEVKG